MHKSPFKTVDKANFSLKEKLTLKCRVSKHKYTMVEAYGETRRSFSSGSIKGSRSVCERETMCVCVFVRLRARVCVSKRETLTLRGGFIFWSISANSQPTLSLQSQ